MAAYPDLAAAVAATGPFDIVDVFRRAEECPAHAAEAVAAGARVLWLQLGIVSWEAAADRPRGRAGRGDGPLPLGGAPLACAVARRRG